MGIEDQELKAVIKLLKTLNKKELELIRDMPDHWRRIRLHLDKLKELLDLLRISIKEKKWKDKNDIRSLIEKLLQEIDPKTGVINQNAYQETEFFDLLGKEETTLKEEQKITFKLYSRLDKKPELFQSLKSRLLRAANKEKLVSAIDIHLGDLILNLRRLLILQKENTDSERKTLLQIKNTLNLNNLDKETIEKLMLLSEEISQRYFFHINLQIRIKEEFYLPFSKFHEEKLSIEDKIRKLLIQKKFLGKKEIMTFEEFMLDYHTITSPSEATKYFIALRKLKDTYSIDKKILNFITKYEEKVLEKSESERHSLLKSIFYAGMDYLTKVHLRSKYYSLFDQLKLSGKNFSIAVIDIDHFKIINDTCGHLEGDKILQNVVRSIQDAIRRSDTIIRYGGEEFVVIFPTTKKENTIIAAQKILENVPLKNPSPINPKTNLPLSDKPITVSIGIATYPEDSKREDQEEDSKKLFKSADEAVYIAKKTGRNRIVAYNSEEFNNNKSLIKDKTA